MNENFQDLLGENVEAVFDSLLDNDIVKEIPILGSSLKIIRGVKCFRDVAYLRKIKLFLETVGDLNEKQKQRLLLDSRKDKNRRAKFGDAIFTTIEQSDSEVKIEYIAIAFEAYLNMDFEESDLRLICHIIRSSFSDELIDIIENDNPTCDLKFVVPCGLAEALYEPLKFDGNAEPKYRISSSSEQLRIAWRKYNSG
jgi:hypothetical protein